MTLFDTYLVEFRQEVTDFRPLCVLIRSISGAVEQLREVPGAWHLIIRLSLQLVGEHILIPSSK